MREGWREVELGEIAQFKPGKYVPKEDYVSGGGIPIFGSNSVMGEYDKALVDEPHSVMAAVGANAGAVRFSPGASWVNNNAFAIIGQSGVEPFFLSLYLSEVVPRASFLAGTGQPYVRRKALAQQMIPLPPLAEQRRIADLLSHIDEGIALATEAEEQLKTFRKGLLSELISPERAESDWQTKTLYDLATYTNGRATKPSERVPEGMPVIKIAELTRGGISSETDRVPRELVLDKHLVREGDLLFAWSGSIGIHRYRGPEAALNQHIFKVVANPGIDDSFLQMLLEHQLQTFAALTAHRKSTMGHIRVADLKVLKAKIPSMAEQQRIASILSSVDGAISSQRFEKNRLIKVRTSLLSVLLSGEHEIPESYDRFLEEAA